MFGHFCTVLDNGQTVCDRITISALCFIMCTRNKHLHASSSDAQLHFI